MCCGSTVRAIAYRPVPSFRVCLLLAQSARPPLHPTPPTPHTHTGWPQGMCIVANKFPHVYAALCTTPEAAAGCRSVNNANVLCLGGRVTSADDGRRPVAGVAQKRSTTQTLACRGGARRCPVPLPSWACPCRAGSAWVPSQPA